MVMADDDVTAPVKEQVEVAGDNQADVTEPEAPTEATDKADVAGDGEPDADETVLLDEDGTDEDEPEAEPAPLEPADITALEERFPWLTQRLSERDRERENAGGQRREAQLKREAGTKEQTRVNVQRFLSEANEAIIGGEELDTARLDFLYDLAQANSAVSLATGYAETLSRHYDVPVEVREQAVERREADDFDGYVTTLIDGVVDHRVAAVKREMTVENEQKLAAEMKARGLEAQPQRKVPPAAPKGRPVSRDGRPTYTEYNAATAMQRQKWQEQKIEPVPDEVAV